MQKAGSLSNKHECWPVPFRTVSTLLSAIRRDRTFAVALKQHTRELYGGDIGSVNSSTETWRLTDV